MLKLNFVNRTAPNLGEAIGLAPERMVQLGQQLDDMVKLFTPPAGVRMVYMADALERIQEFCETDDEFIWCIVIHIEFMAKQGRLVPPK